MFALTLLSLALAVWLAGNSHLKFKQRLQVVYCEVLNIFETTMVGDFCAVAGFCAECGDFILWQFGGFPKLKSILVFQIVA